MEGNHAGAAGGLGQPDRLLDAFRFVSEEYMSVVGRLTAEILSPALEAAISAATAAAGKPNGIDAGASETAPVPEEIVP